MQNSSHLVNEFLKKLSNISNRVTNKTLFINQALDDILPD